jgi:hypothetical protein
MLAEAVEQLGDGLIAEVGEVRAIERGVRTSSAKVLTQKRFKPCSATQTLRPHSVSMPTPIASPE